jgi:predicted RNA-binding Zn-ribbon protein involved in translation (DUF1610 family)
MTFATSNDPPPPPIAEAEVVPALAYAPGEPPEQDILFCPVCSSTIDAAARDTRHECSQCGQEFTMVIDPDRQDRYSSA